MAKGASRAASAAALPPDDPPGVLLKSQGLRVIPVKGESVTPFQPYSGVVVLPSSTAPASRSRATAGASSFQACCGSIALEPRKVGQPLVSNKSLIATGTPSSADSGALFCQRACDAFACARAAAASSRQKALMLLSRLSIRTSNALVTSTGENVLAAKPADKSAAFNAARSAMETGLQALQCLFQQAALFAEGKAHIDIGRAGSEKG